MQPLGRYGAAGPGGDSQHLMFLASLRNGSQPLSRFTLPAPPRRQRSCCSTYNRNTTASRDRDRNDKNKTTVTENYESANCPSRMMSIKQLLNESSKNMAKLAEKVSRLPIETKTKKISNRETTMKQRDPEIRDVHHSTTLTRGKSENAAALNRGLIRQPYRFAKDNQTSNSPDFGQNCKTHSSVPPSTISSRKYYHGIPTTTTNYERELSPPHTNGLGASRNMYRREMTVGTKSEQMNRLKTLHSVDTATSINRGNSDGRVNLRKRDTSLNGEPSNTFLRRDGLINQATYNPLPNDDISYVYGDAAISAEQKRMRNLQPQESIQSMCSDVGNTTEDRHYKIALRKALSTLDGRLCQWCQVLPDETQRKILGAGDIESKFVALRDECLILNKRISELERTVRYLQNGLHINNDDQERALLGASNELSAIQTKLESFETLNSKATAQYIKRGIAHHPIH